MKVIFLSNVKGIGKAGELKEVSNGYAKNFLIRNGLALPATTSAIKQAELKIKNEGISRELDREELARISGQIDGQTLHFTARSGAGERLFGSITASAIAEELSQVIGSSIDKRKIVLDKALREMGSHQVTVRLSKEFEPSITVVIEQEKV